MKNLFKLSLLLLLISVVDTAISQNSTRKKLKGHQYRKYNIEKTYKIKSQLTFGGDKLNVTIIYSYSRNKILNILWRNRIDILKAVSKIELDHIRNAIKMDMDQKF